MPPQSGPRIIKGPFNIFQVSNPLTFLDLAIFAVILLFSLSVHEAAHAASATACGDTLAKSQGRLTLNPFAHIDLFGTVILPLLMFVMAGFMIGYAKPVQFRADHLRNPRRDTVLVALAGPASNFVVAILALVIGRAVAVTAGGPEHLPTALFGFFMITAMLNCVLALFNLIPVPPLDGHYVLDLFLPEQGRKVMRSIGPFGILIALLLAQPLFAYVLPRLQNAVLSALGA